MQLSQKTSLDAQPQFRSLLPCTNSLDTAVPESYDGLTLIMACRSQQKALAARRKLLHLLDQHIAREKQRVDYDGYAERFRKTLEINFHEVDMSMASSVYHFAEEVSEKYVGLLSSLCMAQRGFLMADTLTYHTSYVMLDAPSGAVLTSC